MAYKISGLKAEQFAYLDSLTDGQRAQHGVHIYTADEKPGYPCRVSLADAEVGERLFLLNYAYQPNDTPYKASHAIFVRENAVEAKPYIDSVPVSLSSRLLSLRAFDSDHMMILADIAEGDEIEKTLIAFCNEPEVSYVQLHYARRGCFAAVAYPYDTPN
ncbi:DUF1203 domain-containing protein [Polycladidibacter hongkongensis]|uniref:DUF1203 domain-containing protein n=1 Tax=Polycladidibacter hongkongensis TaxID=1647556 RepID=UPI0008344233|nr:DUF1203 domain-containing protein [Pseudovibrio hongkongensis]